MVPVNLLPSANNQCSIRSFMSHLYTCVDVCMYVYVEIMTNKVLTKVELLQSSYISKLTRYRSSQCIILCIVMCNESYKYLDDE